MLTRVVGHMHLRHVARMHGDGTHARMVCGVRRTIPGNLAAPVYTGTLSSEGLKSSVHDPGRLEAH